MNTYIINCLLKQGANLSREKILRGGTRNAVCLPVIYGNAYRLGAVPHAENGFDLNFFAEMLLFDNLLKLVDYIVGAFDMAGAANTNTDRNHDLFPFPV